MGDFAADFHDVLRAEWDPRGFRYIRSFRWVEETQGPIRRIFEFQRLKGATLSARWGFSLDFVPLFRGRRLRWKRSAKAADFDLCIDPVDRGASGAEGYSFSYLQGYDEPPSRQLLERVTSRSAQVARWDFGRVTSVDNLIGLFDERAGMSFARFSLESYVQTHLAWGLALISVGERVEGEAHILKFCERFGVEWSNPLLLKAEAEASGHAGAHLA
jgi:hypothetical protein